MARDVPRAAAGLGSRLRRPSRAVPRRPLAGAQPAARDVTRPALRVELLFLAATLAVTAAGVVVALQLWDASARTPFHYVFDALFHGAAVKGIVEHGWYLDLPRLGAPHGLELHDFPLGAENLQFAMLKVLGLASGDWALVLNAYYLLGFLLVSAAAFVVLRQVGLARWLSLALASLFALLPYHFVVGQLQMFQATYFAVPVGAFLVLDALGWDVWRAPFLARAAAGAPRATAVRWGVRIALCVVVGSSGSYYAPFTVLLVVVAAAFSVLAGGDRRRLLGAAAVVAVLVGVVALNNAPTLLYRQANGTNAEVANRPLGESDFWGLRIIDLFLPVKEHRLAPLADLKARLERFSPLSPIAQAPQTPLGVAGAAGLAVSLLALAGAVRPSWRGVAGVGERTRLGQLGLLNVTCILFAASTGFSSVFALAGVTQLRAWSRLSVFIAFFALLALGLAVSAPRVRSAVHWRRWRADGPGARLAGAGLVAVVVGLLVLDQTSPSFVPEAGVRVAYERDRAFVQDIEQRMPAGAAVFQLPVAAFPERSRIAGMADYSLLRGYLHSRDLRWSYPAMRGRPTDWAWALGGRPLPAFLDGVTAAGFTGLYVDRTGFLDQARALERELAPLVGPPALESRHGLAFWDLRARAADQRRALGDAGVRRLRRLVLAPVVARWGDGMGPRIGDPPSVVTEDFLPYPELPGHALSTERLARLPAVVELENPLPDRRPVRIRLTVRGEAPEPVPVTVATRGTPPVTIEATPERRTVEVVVALPPGARTLRVTAAAGTDPAAAYRIGNLLVTDEPAGGASPSATP